MLWQASKVGDVNERAGGVVVSRFEQRSVDIQMAGAARSVLSFLMENLKPGIHVVSKIISPRGAVLPHVLARFKVHARRAAPCGMQGFSGRAVEWLGDRGTV